MTKPRYLCMIPNVCAICDKITEGDTLQYGRLFGVLYCTDKKCCEEIKKDMIKYINETMNIPLYGLLTNENEYNLSYNFYRKSEKSIYKIYKGDISIGIRDFFCIRNTKKNDTKFLTIRLEFENKDNKDNNIYSRNVALDNIMFHNKDFYDKLTNCKNIFNNEHIVISFEELSDEIRDSIYMLKMKNIDKKSSDFLF